MFTPKYSITDNILNNIVKFERDRNYLENINLNEYALAKLRLDAFSKDIFHLAHMNGINMSLNTSRKIASGKMLSIDDSKGIYLTNFRNATEYIYSLQPSFYSVQAEILFHLNKISIKDIAEEWDAKYRSQGEEIDITADNWLSLRDVDMPSVEVQAQTLDLIEWIKLNLDKIHPLILIPISIYRLVRIVPFVHFNKFTTLSFAKYLFFKTGMNVNGLFPIVRNFDLFEEEYIKKWGEIITLDDLTSWIEKFTKNLVSDIQLVKENTEKTLDDEKEKNKQPFLNLNRRQLKVLRYLQNIPQVKRDEYVSMLDVSSMTAYRDLNELVKKGLLKITGKGRGTVYTLSTR